MNVNFKGHNLDGPEIGLVGVGVVALVLALTLLNAWIVMVLWGAIAAEFGFRTIGYGTAYLMTWALAVVGRFFKSASKP